MGQRLFAGGLGAAGEFDRRERVALGDSHDVCHDLVGQWTRCGLNHEPAGVIVGQRLKVKRLHHAATDEA